MQTSVQDWNSEWQPKGKNADRQIAPSHFVGVLIGTRLRHLLHLNKKDFHSSLDFFVFLIRNLSHLIVSFLSERIKTRCLLKPGRENDEHGNQNIKFKGFASATYLCFESRIFFSKMMCQIRSHLYFDSRKIAFLTLSFQ